MSWFSLISIFRRLATNESPITSELSKPEVFVKLLQKLNEDNDAQFAENLDAMFSGHFNTNLLSAVQNELSESIKALLESQSEAVVHLGLQLVFTLCILRVIPFVCSKQKSISIF